MKRGNVYLICDVEKNLYKIGVTTGSIEKRMKKLQTGNGTELLLVNHYECDYPFKVEKMLHNHFSNKKVLNEWFELSDEEALSFTKVCEDKDNIIKCLMDNPFFVKTLQ